MGGKVCIAIIVIFVISYKGLDAEKFHLPKTVLPEKYTLLIYTNIYNPQPMFWGYVYINVRCEKKTSEIILHAKNLQIIKHEVRVGLFAKKSLKMLDISDVRAIVPDNQLIISLKKDLEPGRKYQIYIHYMKDFASDFTEFQIRNYTVDEKSIKAAFTKFGSDGAPAVFPCFNNITFKARFKIYLAHPKGIYGFSNMPRMPNSDLPFFEDWSIDEFQESVPMSTYLVSFALVNVKGKKIVDGEEDVAIRIWSMYGSQQFDVAGEMAYEGFKFYSDYFESVYSLPKLDILALPNVGGENNEKYGLLTLSEDTVLYPNSNHPNQKFIVASNMCHVVSHQWIGSFVTMASWSESWFHEALSDYLQGQCVKKIINSSYITDLMELKLVTKMVEGLSHIESTSLPLPVYTEHENSATQGFNSSMTPEKAFFLIRMMSFFLSEEAFHKALIAYMKTYEFDNSRLDQVWAIFTREGQKAGTLKDVSVKKVMDSWITKKTYPVISVIRDFKRNVLEVKQDPFTEYMTDDEIEYISSNDCPIIPINVQRQKNLTEGGKVSFRFWLGCKTVELPIDNDVKSDEWILVNTHMNVLSRTDYDLTTWRLLQKSLLDGKTFVTIDPVTRAHLIYDIFEFCRAEISEISYDFALETIKYLRYENKQCVWFAAIAQLKLIYNAFVRTDLLKPFKRYVKEILKDVFNRKEYSKIDDLPEISAEKSLKRWIVETSCLYGVKECKEQCKSLFLDWYTESINGHEDALFKIPLTIRVTVLCQGIRKTKEEHWDQLYKEYRKYSHSTGIRSSIIKALGCSKKEKILKKYLDMSLDSQKIFKTDSQYVFESLSQNKIGYPLMYEFLRNRYENIEKHRSDNKQILGSYMKTLILSTTRREDLNKVNAFIADIKPRLAKSTNLVANSYDETNISINWYERHEDTFREFFEKFTPKKKSSSRQSSPRLGNLLKIADPKNRDV